MFSHSLSLLLMIGSAFSVALTDYTIHERRHTSPKEWTKGDAVISSMILPMRIGLSHTNLDKGHDLLMDISDLASPNYGKHYTSEEVNELFAPEAETAESVRTWLEAAGIKASESANKAWLQFDVPASEGNNKQIQVRIDSKQRMGWRGAIQAGCGRCQPVRL